MQKSRVGVWVYMFCVKLLDEAYPVGPLDDVWEQAPLFSHGKVALVANQRGVREEKAESAFPKLSTLAFLGAPLDIFLRSRNLSSLNHLS